MYVQTYVEHAHTITFVESILFAKDVNNIRNMRNLLTNKNLIYDDVFPA
jgi:hypothetical protein